MSRFRSLFAPLPLLQRNEERWFWLFIAPFLAGFVLFALLPLIASLALSFMDWNLRGTPKLVGLENYADLVNLEGKGKLVLKAFSNTAMITMIAVPLQLAIGMAFAMLLNQKVRGMAIYRMAFYLPTVVSGVATAALWTWILGTEGLLNKGLDLIGVAGPAWPPSRPGPAPVSPGRGRSAARPRRWAPRGTARLARCPGRRPRPARGPKR